MIKVSVVIPVYNVEKYLEQCIDSILSQTLHDIEIICVDDGSTDKSAAILDCYAEKESRIKVIHKKNSGYGHTMNVGMNAAIGEYIGIVESDDWIQPDMYKSLYEIAIKNNLDFIKSDFYEFVVNQNNEILTECIKIAPAQEDYNRICSTSEELKTFQFAKYTWSGIYKREFLSKNNILHNETPGASYQDNGFWFQTFVYGKRVMFLDKAFYMYKQDNPMSSIHSNGKIYAVSDEFNFLEEILKNLNRPVREYLKLCAFFRVRDGIGNIGRISDEYKLEYLNNLKKDYLLALDNGLIKLTQFNSGEQDMLSFIAKNCEQYICHEKKCRENVLMVLNKYKKIIVYGAGGYGHALYYLFMLHGLKRFIHCFAVTSHVSSQKHVRFIPVKEISSLTKDKDETLVILAVREKSDQYIQMEKNLKNLGFSEVMSYSCIQQLFGDFS